VNLAKKRDEENGKIPPTFHQLMKGLVGVRKEELDAEERKYKKKKKRKRS